MEVVPVQDDRRWAWDGAARSVGDHRGRACVALSSVEGAHVATVANAVLVNGVIEADVSIAAGRSFHGVAWRARGREYESFFVRPHQNGNPDAIQYTPVFNGMSAWQLHHGAGFWNETRFPIDEWFTIRVAFEGQSAAISLDGEQVLHTRLRSPEWPGAFGLLVGGDDLRVAELRFGAEVRVPEVDALPVDIEAIGSWDVSDPFPESRVPARLTTLTTLAEHSWTTLVAEPDGLTNLSRAHAILGEANTVYARTTIESDRAERRPLELGFSDRVVVFLNGERIYRGDNTYRSRDYRFLGSIGWYDTLYLSLVAGQNDLVVAVSEDFGGWGIQARLPH